MTSRWQRNPDVLWRFSDERVLLQVAEMNDAMLLDGSGGAVWRALAEPKTLAELTAVLAQVHGVEPTAIAGDVRDVVSDLTAHGLVHRRVEA